MGEHACSRRHGLQPQVYEAVPAHRYEKVENHRSIILFVTAGLWIGAKDRCWTMGVRRLKNSGIKYRRQNELISNFEGVTIIKIVMDGLDTHTQTHTHSSKGNLNSSISAFARPSAAHINYRHNLRSGEAQGQSCHSRGLAAVEVVFLPPPRILCFYWQQGLAASHTQILATVRAPSNCCHGDKTRN